MEKGSQKTQAYPWICQGFLRTLDLQEIGADRDKKSLNSGLGDIPASWQKVTLSLQIHFGQLVIFVACSDRQCNPG